jgi:hypothetical protein
MNEPHQPITDLLPPDRFRRLIQSLQTLTGNVHSAPDRQAVEDGINVLMLLYGHACGLEHTGGQP